MSLASAYEMTFFQFDKNALKYLYFSMDVFAEKKFKDENEISIGVYIRTGILSFDCAERCDGIFENNNTLVRS